MAVTLCPLAVVAGCKRCPIFSVCPLKSVIGDQPASPAAPPQPESPRARKSGGKKR